MNKSILYLYKYLLIIDRIEIYTNLNDNVYNYNHKLVKTYLRDTQNEDIFNEYDEELYKYCRKEVPQKLSIKWMYDKKEYNCYIWFEEKLITSIFERFYGAHIDTKTDFIIRIDSEKRKYELALFRQGLKEPQIISEDAYQLIVFKNKFEDYRSNNYNQERGAWIW